MTASGISIRWKYNKKKKKESQIILLKSLKTCVQLSCCLLELRTKATNPQWLGRNIIRPVNKGQWLVPRCVRRKTVMCDYNMGSGH